MQSFKGKLNLKLLLHLIRIFFGCVFLLSAVMKLIDLNTFMIALGKFKMLNSWQLESLAYFFPIFELLIGILLILNIKTRLISTIATGLLALFTAVIINKLFEGEEVSCGCFGKLTSDKIDYITVVRNTVLLIMGILLSVLYKDKKYFSHEILVLDKNKILNKIINYVIVTIFFLISVQTIILALQNIELKNRIMTFSSDRETLKQGEKVNAFSGFDLNGKLTEVDYRDKRKTLIFLFSTNCKPCKNNIPNWKYLKNSIDPNKIRIIGVSVDSINATIKYAGENGINYPILSVIDDKFKIDYKTFMTPQTYLINENAIVIKVWNSLLNNSRLKEILTSLNE